MERKTKHRILGIFVVIGLVIISLPFFESKREPTPQVALVKAPPFPAQANSSVPEQSSLAENLPQTKSVENAADQQPDDTIASLHPSIVSVKTPEINPSNSSSVKSVATEESADADRNDQVSELKPVVSPESNEVEKTHHAVIATKTLDKVLKEKTHLLSSKNKTKVVAKLKKVSPIAKPSSGINLHADASKIDNNGLLRLKNAAWVIQIGSFKNKGNALRLVNKLRANGYRAFIQQVSNTVGDENTRVFVGPENKQTSARALASQLETNLHIRGIVISYKPLTL